jgi:multiple sugar transport system ATP-binding protein
LFVAEFIGSPAMNLVGADLRRENGSLVAEFGENRLAVGDDVVANHPALTQFEGRRVILGIRPEDLEDAELVAAGRDGGKLSAVVDVREDMGSEVFLHFGVKAPAVRGEDVEAAKGADSLAATEEEARRKGSLFVARVDRTTRAREGERVELAVTTSRLHFFDPDTGGGIYDATDTVRSVA